MEELEVKKNFKENLQKVGEIMALSEALILGGAGLAGSMLAGSQSKAAAKRLIRWQDMLSRTQYQRMTEDMRKAGLNPVLGISSGGNAVPSGATPTIPDYGQALSSGLSSGAQVKIASSTVRNLEGIAKQNQAQGKISEWVVDKLEKDDEFRAAFVGSKAADTAGLPAWLGLPIEQFNKWKEGMKKANKGNKNKTTINQPMIPLTGRPQVVPNN